MRGNIQLCAFNFEGLGIDAMTETDVWYETPKAGKDAARAILTKHAEVYSVWVRKINAGHLRTVCMMTREG